MRYIVLPVLPVLFFLALAAPLAAQEPSPPVLLGINYPLTGPYSVEGLDQIRAAQLAVDELNTRGGILGRRIELVAKDSASDVVRTRMNVNDLIDQGCSMIFGGSSSAVAIAASEECQKRNVPFFGTLTYSTATTLDNAHRVSFRECNNSRMSARVMADWLNDHYAGASYYYITADYTWGWTTEKAVRTVTETQDASVHPGALTPLGATDFSRELRQARAAQPDVLVLVLFGKDMAYALAQAQDMGIKDECQIVVPNLTLGMAERAGAQAMEGVVGTVPWTWSVPYLYEYARGVEFIEAFVARYRRYPSSSGASSYTIVHEYASAVERSGSFSTNSVIIALEGHEYQLLKDPQTWRALDHQSVQTVYMVRGNSLDQVLADPLRLDFFTVLSFLPGQETVLAPNEWRALRSGLGLLPHLEDLHAP
ncbi:MAG: ABC transporter substrate-binding protein [Desulfovibrio sp.]|nr:MAG: ABC transporter substrate-binding protein [Desulfovibrio sp.]